MKLSMRSNKGFGVLELVVAVAIVAIIASVALPFYISWQRSHRLRGAATNLMADLEAAKMRAVRENSFVAVLFSKAATRFLSTMGQGAELPATGSETEMKLWSNSDSSPLG